MKKANVLLITGAALLIIGIAVIALMARSGDDAQEPARRAVLVATADIEGGAMGTDLVADGKVEVSMYEPDDIPPGALTDSPELDGWITAEGIEEGDVIVRGILERPSLREASITIPEDRQALALTVGFTEGGAGYIAPGDRVNIYTNIQPKADGAPLSPLTRLILSDIEVLDVSVEIGARRAGEEESATPATPGQITLLLAIAPDEAERAIFGVEQNTLWFTLIPDDQGESTTDGVTYEDGYLPGDAGP